ncbi:MAG TPA: hypothetical protein VGX00_00620 [Thermoplasmata archaeon]|nr:hypothetical protein [Thermoplasmata archaeon]
MDFGFRLLRGCFAWTGSFLILAGVLLVVNSTPLGPFYSLLGPRPVPDTPPIWIWAPILIAGIIAAAIGWGITAVLIATSSRRRIAAASIAATMVFLGMWLSVTGVYGPILGEGAVVPATSTALLLAGPGYFLGFILSLFGWVFTTVLLANSVRRPDLARPWPAPKAG